ncbi:MAG: DUF4058 family protein [Planctomycetes bacterium]|nr:DUF4058 family protein [Planctomycetota bacterium]
MPLYNHFVAPLRFTHPWSGFHGTWATMIARQLNQDILPPGFYAIPTVELGGPVEIGVAAVEDVSGPPPPRTQPAAEPWAPPAPAATLAVDFTGIDRVEVQVFYDEGEPLLAAAIELVSPKNKDRPSQRRAFAVKCANYLQQAASVIIVDVVTVRRQSLHLELLQTLDVSNGAIWESPSGLYAVVYRTVRAEEQPHLDIWPEALALGSPLPCVPLWLGVDIVVPLDLEKSYLAACESLRLGS